MNRTLNVVRMQLVNRQTFVWIPLIILGGAFVLMLAVIFMVPGDEPKIGGAAQAPLWYFLVVGIYALALSFPFSQAMGVTRREFHLGTLATAALTSIILAVLFTLGGLVEEATNGYGRNGFFFRIPWLTDGPWFVTLLIYFSAALLFFTIGYTAAAIYKRWGTLWLTVALVVLALGVVGLGWILIATGTWTSTFDWVGAQGPQGVGFGMLGATVVLSAASYGVLRRTTP
ncbi:hypothetical protein [Microbacterium sp. CJ88]|uniref:hypothetical protein n=1 Tax=Microbacterium sp. CJ88 TaxID=3445672 RepID=UPI003F65BD4D